MKKIILTITCLLFLNLSYGQKNFVWDSVYITKGTKIELFSKAKLVVAEVYNSANDVIQNNDPDAGIILLKGSTTLDRSENLGVITINHVFTYTLKIMVKDDKYRIVLNDIYNSKVFDNSSTPGYFIPIPVSEESIGFKRSSKKGYAISNEKHAILMSQLKIKFQILFRRISEEMNKDLIDNSGW